MKKAENVKQIDVKAKQKRTKIIRRLCFDIFAFFVLIISGTILLNKSLNFETEKSIKYSEKSDVDYKVYLTKNDFYEEEYLGKDMLYVANLIDKLAIDFDYTFESEEKEDIDFNYSVIAKLAISNPTGTKSYYEKTYPIVDNKVINMKNSISQNIKETVNIDYPHYNMLANSFKNQYGIDADSKLTIYMLINKKNTKNSGFTLDNSSVMNIEIPLSERSVDISLDYKEINETSNIIKKQRMTINDYIPLIISIILIIISLIMVIKTLRNINKLIKKKSAYDKYVSKLLKEYDRLIAESSTLLSFENKEIININKFTELLDIHDNLQIPIMYYEIEEHEKCYFYIAHDQVIYLLEINKNNIDNK